MKDKAAMEAADDEVEVVLKDGSTIEMTEGGLVEHLEEMSAVDDTVGEMVCTAHFMARDEAVPMTRSVSSRASSARSPTTVSKRHSRGRLVGNAGYTAVVGARQRATASVIWAGLCPQSRCSVGRWPGIPLWCGDLDRVAHRVLHREAPIRNPLRLGMERVNPSNLNRFDGTTKRSCPTLNAPGRHRRRAALPTQLSRPTIGVNRAIMSGKRDLQLTCLTPDRVVLCREVGFRQTQHARVEAPSKLQITAMKVEERPHGRTVALTTNRTRNRSEH